MLIGFLLGLSTQAFAQDYFTTPTPLTENIGFTIEVATISNGFMAGTGVNGQYMKRDKVLVSPFRSRHGVGQTMNTRLAIAFPRAR